MGHLEELRSTEFQKMCDENGRIDGNRHFARMMAVICRMRQRERNWLSGVYDEAQLPSLDKYERDVRHFAVWVIRTYGRPPRVGGNGERVLTFSRGEPDARSVEAWISRYVQTRGAHRETDGMAQEFVGATPVQQSF